MYNGHARSQLTRFEQQISCMSCFDRNCFMREVLASLWKTRLFAYAKTKGDKWCHVLTKIVLCI